MPAVPPSRAAAGSALSAALGSARLGQARHMAAAMISKGREPARRLIMETAILPRSLRAGEARLSNGALVLAGSLAAAAGRGRCRLGRARLVGAAAELVELTLGRRVVGVDLEVAPVGLDGEVVAALLLVGLGDAPQRALE